MLASKYPILATHFVPFSHKRGWHHAICYGVLMCKLDLGKHKNGANGVGYVANLHNVAYEGKDSLILLSLDEVLSSVEKFQAELVRIFSRSVIDSLTCISVHSVSPIGINWAS